MIQPPKHLTQELAELRRELDEYFRQRYLEILHSLTLRDGISTDMALEYFSVVWEMFNGYFQKKADQNGDYHALIEDHEGWMSEIFDIMLYGIAKEPGKNHHETGEPPAGF